MRLEFLEAGEIVTTHGVRGEMKVLPWADGPDFLLDFNRVRIDGKDISITVPHNAIKTITEDGKEIDLTETPIKH